MVLKEGKPMAKNGKRPSTVSCTTQYVVDVRTEQTVEMTSGESCMISSDRESDCDYEVQTDRQTDKQIDRYACHRDKTRI